MGMGSFVFDYIINKQCIIWDILGHCTVENVANAGKGQ